MDGANVNKFGKAAGSYQNSQLNGDVIAARKYMLQSSSVSEKPNETMRKLTSGGEQTVKGEIVNLQNKEVTVRTDNGDIVKAKVLDTGDLYIGQKLEFKANMVGDTLFLEPLSKGEPGVNSVIGKALASVSLPQSAKNISIVQALLNNNMSVDKQSIMKIISQTYQNPNVSIDTIVLMNKHKIPMENDNATQFENYRNYEHRIIKELGQIATSVPEAFENINSGKKLADINHEVVDILSSGPRQLKTPPPLASSAFTGPNDKNMLISVLSHFDMDPQIMEGIKDGHASLLEVNEAISDAYAQAREKDVARAGHYRDYRGGSGMISARAMFENPVITNIIEKNATFARSNAQLSSFLGQSQLSDIANALNEIAEHKLTKETEALTNVNMSDNQNLTDIKNLANDVLSGKINAFEFMKKLDGVMEELDSGTALKLLKMPAYKDIIREAIISKWTITPDNLSDKKEIENTYERIYEQTGKLSDLVTKALGGEENQLSQQSSNVKNNINFMDTLNQMFSYIQLPVKLANQNIHSELFVMTDKKKLRANNGNISVLLRLEMEHLGLIDVRINKEGNKVLADFMLPDSKDMDLFKINMEQLEYALLEKGFLLEAKISKKESEIDIVKDFIENDSDDTVMKRYTFDLRA